MRLTIIIPDMAVYKNNESYSNLHWGGTPSNVNALQWFDTDAGWIEFNDGKPQEDITELPQWALNALDAWEVAWVNSHKPPSPPTPEEIQAANLEAAKLLLTESDFTQLADVNLINKQDWVLYREQVRAIANNPPSTPVEFPSVPPLIWV
jgi:hypothetical protein